MTHLGTAGAFLVAVVLTTGGGAWAGDDPHRHADAATPLPTTAPVPQPRGSDSLPSLGSAEDMLKAMESMPAHDAEACCSLRRSPSPTNQHDHDH